MKKLDIYTDGSHLKRTTGRLGIGGVLIDLGQNQPLGKKLDEFGVELDTRDMKANFGPGAENCSNPTAELTAVLISLKNFGPLIKDADIITIHADYIGVKEWMTGNWKIKEPYIAKIKIAIENEIVNQKISGQIEYAWVRGHQKYSPSNPDIHWNTYVDLLAKGDINK